MPALLERQGGRQPAQPATHHGDQVIRREPAAPLPPPRRRRLARLVGWRCRGRPRLLPRGVLPRFGVRRLLPPHLRRHLRSHLPRLLPGGVLLRFGVRRQLPPHLRRHQRPHLPCLLAGEVLLRPAHGSQVAGTSCCPSAAPALPLPQS